MYTVKSYLSDFPDVMRITDIARALGCGEPAASRVCNDGSLSIPKLDGEWVIAKDDFINQVFALRTRASRPKRVASTRPEAVAQRSARS